MPDPLRTHEDAPDRTVVDGDPPRAIFGRYQVLARLGRGGMAEVFVTAAEGAAGVKKLAVVKRLRTDLTKDEDPDAEDRFRAMFLAEAQLSARLNHPNIVHTYEVGEERGSLFIAMEYIEGQSLHALSSALRRAGTALPPVMAVRIACEVLSALHYAHEMTDLGGERLVIVHRDVSPQNVMLTYDGGVKLVDFGVAKASRSSVATEVGTIKGKVRYMAPEQVAGTVVDRRADLFAVGVFLWELLAQKRLVRGENDAQALLSLVSADAPSLLVEAPAVDPQLAAVVMRALSRSPDRRFQTALEMRSGLEGFLAESRDHVTSESIGALVRSTFTQEREAMSERLRKALARPTHTDDGVVVDWGAELSVADSGASKPPISRSASRPIAARPPDFLLGDGGLSASPDLTVSERPQRRRGALWIPLFALLAGVGGAAGVMFMFKGRMNAPAQMSLETMPSAEAPAPTSSLPTGAERAVPAGPSITVAAAPPKTAAEQKAFDKWAAKNKAKDDKTPAPEAKKESSSAPAEAAEKGFLTIDTYPWTRVTVNGRTLGTTPLVRAPMAAGAYTVVLENPDEKISERVSVTIKPGETVAKRLAF